MSDPLAPLRAKFVARCAEDLAALEAADSSADERRRIVHRLAGSAGMFGHRDLGALAGELDDRAVAGDTLEPSDYAPLLYALRALGQA